MMYMSDVELSQSLRKLGTQRIRLRTSLEKNSVEITQAVRAAFADGIPKAEIARLARISRVTVDAMLKD